MVGRHCSSGGRPPEPADEGCRRHRPKTAGDKTTRPQDDGTTGLRDYGTTAGRSSMADRQNLKRGVGTSRPQLQPPPLAKLKRPSGDGLCQRTRDGLKPSVARGGRLRSAGASRSQFADQRLPNGLPIGKSARPQVGKPAVRSPNPPPPEARWPQADLKFTPDWGKRPLLSNGKSPVIEIGHGECLMRGSRLWVLGGETRVLNRRAKG